jgi:hypothetical protein
MASIKVVKVRKAPSADQAHKHVVGVVDDGGVEHTVAEVVASLGRGDTWWTAAPGEPEAEILALPRCPKAWCLHGPYLASTPGESLASDLEKLPSA